ncbi:MAG: glycosyltransferase, partial [Methylobacteriaceae bacterium]|nr:glycosyltransferase [Methylobacteriaceae bacterium]
MKVIILCDFATPGGGSQAVAIASARALAEAGVAVTFVHAVPGRDARLDHPLIECICLGLADVWDRPALSGAIEGVWNRAADRALRAILPAAARAGEAVIHIHQWTRGFSPSVFDAALRAGPPVVVTAHDYFIACPNGVYYRFDRQAPCALTPLSAACLMAPCDPRSRAFKAIRVARSAATATALRGADLDIVHVSDRGRDTLQPFLPKTFRHHRIDNPVDASKGEPARIEPGAAFAYIGRLTPEKGAIVAAAAARQAGVPIRFVGEGPAEAAIRAANPAAELLGWQSRAAVASLLRERTRAVIAPSLWYETGPLTVYEAAASGVAALASERCGASERVRDGITGLVVAPSADGLAAAMRLLAD